MDYVSCDEIIATKGDLIAFRRVRCWCIAYCHFAVFTESADSEIIIPEKIGDRITIGVRSPWLSSKLWEFRKFWEFSKFLVTKPVEETMQTLCDQHGCRVNNLDEAAEERGLVALKPDVIVARAREFLRQDNYLVYDLVYKNCEHFATECRYGEAFSLQVPDCISKLFMKFLICKPEHYLTSIPDEVRKSEESKKNIEVDEKPNIKV